MKEPGNADHKPNAECLPHRESSSLKRRKLSPKSPSPPKIRGQVPMSGGGLLIWTKFQSSNVILIDDDNDEDDYCVTGTGIGVSTSVARSDIQSSKSPISSPMAVFHCRQDWSSARLELKHTQKWRLCAMWRNKESLSEIAIKSEVSESVLHAYIYELIKKDAMHSAPVGLKGSSRKC